MYPAVRGINLAMVSSSASVTNVLWNIPSIVVCVLHTLVYESKLLQRLLRIVTFCELMVTGFDQL